MEVPPSYKPLSRTLVGTASETPVVPLVSADDRGSHPGDARFGMVSGDDILPTGVEYKLTRRLGTGTFGEVYEAEAPGGVRVAVKRILRDMNHPASLGELESLEAIKRVSHPFLLQTQAYWVCRDRLVIVMELADGALADRIDEYKARGLPGVPPEELVPFFLQVAEALDYLHSRNVSHRDIKPQNLLHLKGYAKVADFGLARVHAHTQTTVNQMIGTPQFMAPEVWGNHVSLHSDQYSLAATYVSARLGRPLFDSPSLIDLALNHRDKTPDLAPLPAAEQRVLLKALAKKPDDRYPNCTAFATALRDAVLPPPAPQPPARPRWRATPLALAAGACATAIALAVLLRPVPPPTTSAVPPPQTESIWCPAGWQPVAAAGTATLPDGRSYHKQLTRTVGGEELTAIAIPPARQSDPPLFYMLRDKVTNRVFGVVWAQASADVALTRRNFGPQAKDLLPEKWKDADDLREMRIDPVLPAAPVVNVTLPEAALVAEQLGGVVPTPAQWSKAVGQRDNPARESSAGNGPFDLGGPPPHGLALGLKRGPWPTDRPTPDVSVYGIHQLVSNGYEWTRQTSDGHIVSPLPLPPLPPRMLVVGQTWDASEVLTFAETTQGPKRSYPWDDCKSGIGFRVVIEASPGTF